MAPAGMRINERPSSDGRFSLARVGSPIEPVVRSGTLLGPIGLNLDIELGGRSLHLVDSRIVFLV